MRAMARLVASGLVAAACVGAARAQGADDGGAVLKSPLPAPVFAPFGERAVAAIGSGGAGAVVVVELAGETSVRVVSERGVDPFAALPRWSPDGSRVAWSYGSAAMVSGLEEGATPEKRATGKDLAEFDPTEDWALVARGTYSPDGVRVAFVVPRGERAGTYTAPVIGGKTTRVHAGTASVIAWSADGKKLALAIPKKQIVVCGPAGEDAKEIGGPSPEGPVALRFTADGAALLVFAGSELRRHPIDGGEAGEPREIVGGAHGEAVAAAWSPADEILAIVTDRGVLGLVKGEGGKLVKLSADGARLMSGPAWSQDGARLAALEWGGPGEVAFTAYEAATGKVQRVPLFYNPSERED